MNSIFNRIENLKNLNDKSAGQLRVIRDLGQQWLGERNFNKILTEKLNLALEDGLANILSKNQVLERAQNSEKINESLIGLLKGSAFDGQLVLQGITRWSLQEGFLRQEGACKGLLLGMNWFHFLLVTSQVYYLENGQKKFLLDMRLDRKFLALCSFVGFAVVKMSEFEGNESLLLED